MQIVVRKTNNIQTDVSKAQALCYTQFSSGHICNGQTKHTQSNYCSRRVRQEEILTAKTPILSEKSAQRFPKPSRPLICLSHKSPRVSKSSHNSARVTHNSLRFQETIWRLWHLNASRHESNTRGSMCLGLSLSLLYMIDSCFTIRAV